MSTKLTWNMAKAACGILLLSGLAGCFGDDDDDKVQDISVQGKAVKGTLVNADVSLYNASNMNTPIGTGTTDANGEFEISISGDSADKPVVVKVTSNANTTMVCDADKCGSVNRGDEMTGSELDGLELTSHFVAQQGDTEVSDLPVNSLTTAATEVVMAQAGDFANLTPEGLKSLQEKATEIVMQSFGLNSSTATNLFEINIPDANKLATELSGDSNASFKSQLAMLNAAFASEADISAEIEKFYDGINASINSSGLTSNFSAYLSTLKTRYEALYAALNADGSLPTGVNIPDLAQFSWPDNISFEDDGIIIDGGSGGDGDWTLVITGTSTVTTPVEVTVDIPEVKVTNTTPPTNTDEIGTQFKEITEVDGVTVSNYSFEEVERSANKVVIKYSATISVSSNGITATQTQNLTYTWTK
ncbi:lipoprotein [Catenovulum agarivorans DS-2]|uniref:Lipoprotein n=1 Tax=Catenovulum agarivorans DS-2 TaxID=1328313 RepID=W7QPV4_9ALTE|nr:hypothetical protein [Catenovulum agarivorans]EWH09918.1 lipoprotein [Catenovulum agarivorans DS-2]